MWCFIFKINCFVWRNIFYNKKKQQLFTSQRLKWIITPTKKKKTLGQLFSIIKGGITSLFYRGSHNFILTRNYFSSGWRCAFPGHLCLDYMTKTLSAIKESYRVSLLSWLMLAGRGSSSKHGFKCITRTKTMAASFNNETFRLTALSLHFNERV